MDNVGDDENGVLMDDDVNDCVDDRDRKKLFVELRDASKASR
jgi:hypothetical protein